MEEIDSKYILDDEAELVAPEPVINLGYRLKKKNYLRSLVSHAGETGIMRVKQCKWCRRILEQGQAVYCDNVCKDEYRDFMGLVEIKKTRERALRRLEQKKQYYQDNKEKLKLCRIEKKIKDGSMNSMTVSTANNPSKVIQGATFVMC